MNHRILLSIIITIIRFTPDALSQETEKNKMDTKYLLENGDKNADGKLSPMEWPQDKMDYDDIREMTVKFLDTHLKE